FAPSYDFFNYYFTLVVTPMFILGGVFFPITTLPDALQSFVQLLPLTHAIALIRPLVAGGEVHNVLLHLSVLAAYALVGYYLAVVLVRRKLRV
ncbi:MAG: ABC transporter permease, partial [Gammaproteobacteria bacterium]|nr:ABC transporter permease [Gammaproteobacteria bacterium]